MLAFIQFIEPNNIHISVKLHQNMTRAILSYSQFYYPKKTKIALNVKGQKSLPNITKNLTTSSTSVTTVDMLTELHQFWSVVFFQIFCAHTQAQTP